jgi:hypothetical protein
MLGVSPSKHVAAQGEVAQKAGGPSRLGERGKVDPLLRVKARPMNHRQARESGLCLKT